MQPMTLVTGGVRGLGLAFARMARERGDAVHITYRSSHELARQREEEFPGAVHLIDHASETGERALLELVERKGGVRHVVHCVGEYVEKALSETTPAEVERMFQSNVFTALRVFEALRGPLEAASGSFVFLGCAGLEGLRGKRDAPAYAAAKTALIVLARSLALEVAPSGVRVNVVSPGVIPHEHAAPETFYEGRFESIPLGRPGRPDDVASALLYLTSDAAGYVTGSNLEVAGGWPA